MANANGIIFEGLFLLLLLLLLLFVLAMGTTTTITTGKWQNDKPKREGTNSS